MGVLRVFLAEDLLCIQRSFSESSMDLFMLPHHQELCYFFCCLLFLSFQHQDSSYFSFCPFCLMFKHAKQATMKTIRRAASSIMTRTATFFQSCFNVANTPALHALQP